MAKASPPERQRKEKNLFIFGKQDFQLLGAA